MKPQGLSVACVSCLWERWVGWRGGNHLFLEGGRCLMQVAKICVDLVCWMVSWVLRKADEAIGGGAIFNI